MGITRKYHKLLLIYESAGFLLTIILSWTNEILDLPGILFGGSSSRPNWRESILETALAILVWAIVIYLTRKVLARLHYLENFLSVCAWCRKIEHKGQWMSMEEYFDKGLNTHTSHGMCPECASRFRRDLDTLKPTLD